MSRIHEALLKAEQERAAMSSQDASGLAGSASGLEVRAAEDVMTAPAVDPRGPNTAAGELTYNSLAAGCAQLPWKPDPQRMLFFDATRQYGAGMEEFRTLRSRLYQLRRQHPLKVLLVASALPGEGKSFVAANLAQVMAREHGRRVLLVDADLRWSRLHLFLGTPASPGLTEYLRSQTDECSAIQRGAMEGLFFLPGGTPSSTPAELIASPRLKLLLERVSSCFDWIIFDSPAAMPVSDAAEISELCDGVLMVVQSGGTPVAMVQKAREGFRRRPLLGVVLNRIAPRDLHSGYYYNYYGGGRGTAGGEN